MEDIVHLNIAQCQFDWAILDLQPIPELFEIGIEITLLPETQGSWWSELEHKRIPQKSGIYAIVNTLNGHFYIGSAVNLQDRKWLHFHSLQKDNHHSRYLQRAYNHYGTNAFRFVVVELVTNKENLIVREQHYIDTFDPHYNIARVAGSSLGIKRSEEHRAKTSVASKGRKRKPLSEEQKANISAAKKGKPMSEKHKAHMNAMQIAKRGKPLSEEHKKILSTARKGHEVSEKTRTKISERLKGNTNSKGHSHPHSEESRKKIREAHKGKPLSEEHKAKLSEAKKGKKRGPMSEEARANIIAAQQARRKREKADKQD